jgi:hypothetical protein
VVRAVFSRLRGVTRLYNNSAAVFSVHRGPCRDYTRQLSVGYSRGKLVVEEELEVSL